MARRPGKTIDYKQWDGIAAIALTMGVDATQQGAGLAAQVPLTILRCRGRILVSADSPADGQITLLGIGLGITSSDAFTAGAGSMPDPIEEPEYPWLWWDVIAVQHFGGAAPSPVELTPFGDSCREVHVDTKAMRKMKPGQTLSWTIQSARVLGAGVLKVEIATTRVLFGT